MKSAAKSRPVELALSPVNNLHLANLCGPLDENLRQIETALDVTITRRGERFSLHGEPTQTRRSGNVAIPFCEPRSWDLQLSS